MPSDTGETTRVAELVCESATLLLLLAADDANLVAEFATFFGKRMDVEG